MRWLADENFNNDIIRGLRRRLPAVDIVRVQDVGLLGRDDDAVLEWAAIEDRVLLTHDVTTITDLAYRRLMRSQRMPGVFEVRRSAATGRVIEDLALAEECSQGDEWNGRILYLPFH